MAHVITSGATVLTPTVVEDYESASRVGTVVHDIIGRADPDVTLRPAATRTGRLRMTFPDEASSRAAEIAFRAPAVFAWTAPLSSVSMTFVPQDDITRRLLDTGRWVLEVGYREVAA